MKRDYGKLRRKMLQHVLAIAVIGLVLWGLAQFLYTNYGRSLPDTIEMQVIEEGSLVLDANAFDALFSVIARQQNAFPA